MKSIAVTGDRELLEALADRWGKNGWKALADVETDKTYKRWNELQDSDKFLFLDKSSGTWNYCDTADKCKEFALPDDWNELADLKPEPEFKEGDWVWYVTQCGDGSGGLSEIGKKKQLVRINILEPYRGTGLAEVNADFDAKTDLGWRKLTFKGIVRKATPEEVEKHLIEEAKRRYNKGDYFGWSDRYDWEQLFDPECDFNYYHEENCNNGRNIGFDPDSLYHRRHMIYRRGEWAEIIDQTPEIKINGHKVSLPSESQWPPKVRVGCTDVDKSDFKHLYRYISEYDLSIHRKGEDITEQIKEIAKQL